MPAEFNSENSRGYGYPLEDGAEDEALWSLLSVYMDGEATPEEAAKVESLLREDPAYARRFDFLKTTSQFLQSVPEVEPPVSLRDAIFAATIERPTLRRRLTAGWNDLRAALTTGMGRYVLPTGALAAASLVAFVVWSRSHTVTPTANPGSRPGEIVFGNKPSLLPTIKFAPPTRGTGDKKTPKRDTPELIPPKMEMVESGPMVHVNYNPKPVRPQLAALKLKPSKKMIRKDGRLQIKPMQKPSDLDQEPKTEYADYVPRPMMDLESQRPVQIVRDNSLMVPDIHTDDSGTASANGATAANPSDKTTDTVTAKTASSHIIRREGRMLIPDGRRILTSADLRREREAANLGYDRATMESIQRQQASVAFVGKF